MKAMKLKTVKLDKKNKLVLVKLDDIFKVISLEKKWYGWKRSEYALDYETNLTGMDIVKGDYNEFKREDTAIKWMNFLSKKFNKRVQFLGK